MGEGEADPPPHIAVILGSQQVTVYVSCYGWGGCVLCDSDFGEKERKEGLGEGGEREERGREEEKIGRASCRERV